MMTNEELSIINNPHVKQNNKFKALWAKVEEKNYIWNINQYSALFTRYNKLQETLKLSSKHNKTQNGLFTPKSMSTNYSSQQFGSTRHTIFDTMRLIKEDNSDALVKESERKSINICNLLKSTSTFTSSFNILGGDNKLHYKSLEEEENFLKEQILEIKMKKTLKGLTSISFNRDTRQILVTAMSSSHYLYDPLYMDQSVPQEFKGHKTTFFTKSIISPDGRYILSGSNDSSICFWENSTKNKNNSAFPINLNESVNKDAYKLTGFHNQEVIID